MVSAKKTLSILLTVILVMSLTFGTVQYYTTSAFAAGDEAQTAEEATPLTELAEEPVVVEESLASTDDQAVSTLTEPVAAEESLEPEEALPYWQTDPVYQDILNSLDAAVAAGAITSAAMKVTGGGSASGVSGTIYMGHKEVLSNGTNAPDYDNYSGQHLTTREGLPTSGMTSDRSVLVLVEEREASRVYEATFLFGSSSYPETPFTAFFTFVVVEKEEAEEESKEIEDAVCEEAPRELKDSYSQYVDRWYSAYYSGDHDTYTMNANFTVGEVKEDGTVTGTVGSTSLTILGTSGTAKMLTDGKPAVGETSNAALLIFNGSAYDAIFLFGDMSEGATEGYAIGGLQVTLERSELAVPKMTLQEEGIRAAPSLSLLNVGIGVLSLNPNDFYVGQQFTGYFTGGVLWYNNQVYGGVFKMAFNWDNIYIECFMNCLEPNVYGPEALIGGYNNSPVTLTIASIDRAAGYIYLNAWSTGPAAGYQDIAANNIPVQFNFTGDIILTKQSSSPGITDNHPLYNLAGTQYGLYRSWSNANTDTSRLHTFTVSDNNGTTNPARNLSMGTYYIKELKAGEGYKLDPTIYTVQHNSATTTFVAKDSPLDDPVLVIAQKLDTMTGEAYGKDDPNGHLLADGEFTIRYWDNYYTTIDEAETSGEPTRTWVIKTQATGRAVLTDSLLVAGSDPLYKNIQGDATIPLGTCAIQETTPPPGYLLPNPNTVSLQQIKTTGDPLGSVTRLNTIIVNEQPHVVEVEKRETDASTPVSNTEFTLYKESAPGAGDWEVITTHVTDEFGKCVFSPVAVGSYKLDETKSNPAYAELEESGDSAHFFEITPTSTEEVQIFQNDLIQVSIDVFKKTIPLTNTALDGTSDQVGNHVGQESYLYHLGARNNSNVRVDEFVITDSLEFVTSKGYRMTTLWTGTTPAGMDFDNLMHVLYKTNLTDPSLPVSFEYNPMSANPANPNNSDNTLYTSVEPGWVVWRECVSTTTAIRLDVADLPLRDGEYITGIRAVYGGVVKGFYSGKGWETNGNPQSYSGDRDTIMTMDEADTYEEFELRNWSYAVVATGDLLPIDEMGNETVMQGSVRADLYRNWGDDTPVLTDIAKDMVETRVIKAFKYDKETLGITTGGLSHSFGLPFTGDLLWISVLMLAIVSTLGMTLIVVGAKRRRRIKESRSDGN